MYTIKHAAELTGISPATLRAWERRYSIVSPERTEAGYRLYDRATLRRLSLMASLVGQGWSAREAAAEVARRSAALDRDESAGIGAPGAPLPAGAVDLRAPALTSPEVERLIDAGRGLDPVAVSDVVDDLLSRGSFERAVDEWLMPALSAVGEAWASGRLNVAGEHLIAYAVQRRLAAAYDAAGHVQDGPRLLIGLPPRARHELGLLAFATAARRQGMQTAYVGADLPIDDWAEAIADHRAECAVLAVPRSPDVLGLLELTDRIRGEHPDVTLAVGGRFQDDAPADCLRLGHRIGDAPRVLREALRGVPAG